MAVVATLLGAGLAGYFGGSHSHRDWFGLHLQRVLAGRGIGLAGGWFNKQIVWVTLGTALAFTLAQVDYRVWLRQAWWLYLASIILLVLVLVAGTKVYGAYRWLNVFGVQVQPSEFAKVALVILLARILGGGAIHPRSFGAVVVTLLLMAVPFLLILKEPDLGTAAILLPTTLLILLAAGAAWRYLLGLGLLAALSAPLGWFFLSNYQRERIATFLDPSRDPLGSGWNALQSAIAVGSGGWSGKGFLKGTQNVLGFLPRTVAPTDFIFPVIAEETGFIGASLLLLVFGVLLTCYLRVAGTTRDPAGSLLATGMASLLFCHVVVNIGMTIGLLPITGLPLPLVSSGGSFMLSTMAGFGLVQSVYVRRMRREE